MTGHSNTAHRREGSSAVEFALVGPLLIVLLMGTVVYGGWFWLAQSVQSLASESARAAIGGLDAMERESLARSFVAGSEGGGSGLDLAKTAVVVESDAEAIRVRISYDIASHPLMKLAVLIPPPPATIERSAVVRIGGY